MDKKIKVSIISRESDKKTLDIVMLENELKKRGAEVTVLSKLLTKEKSLRNAAGYIGQVMRQEAAILASDTVVLDTYCIPASMLPHHKRTKVIQIWHALAAIKKFGWQTVGMEGGSSEKIAKLMRMHHGYDYVISSSDITAKHFAEAFRVSPDKIVKQGLPRIDYIKSVSSGERQEDMQKKIYAKYPQLKKNDPTDGKDKKIVLYAPTFRRGKAVDVSSLAEALDSKKYELVVKLHPLYRGNNADSDASIIYDEEFSSYDWLSVCDIIISDYSSFVVESTLAVKPLYIYAYDLDEYSRSTGLNVDYSKEPIAPYVFTVAAELGKAVSDPYDMDALYAFRDRYIDIDTENCTEKLAEFILSQAAKKYQKK